MTHSEHKPFVVLGVTGGIAAYKAVEICRQLVDAGCHVAPVLTKDATRFIAPLTFTALASEPAQTEIYDGLSAIPHTRLGQAADLIVIAPATAHLLARYAHGLADDLLTTTLLATRAPVLVAPAMHTEMWEHPSVGENLSILTSRGVHVVGPGVGHLAGGDEGAGRLEDSEIIVGRALEILGASRPTGDFAGTHVVVSAGGTREAIDPVRYLTNRSSGKQGHAIAEAAANRGARVTLVTSSQVPAQTHGPGRIDVIRVESAAEMGEAMLREAKEAEVVVMAAAVADFRPSVILNSKFKREQGALEIVLEPTDDILAGLVQAKTTNQVIVGFAAETENALENGAAKLKRKGCDVLVVNDVSAEGVGFDYDTNAVNILEADGMSTSVALSSKRTVAEAVLDRVVRYFNSNQGAGHE
jgi:phosphopantothenoylcysteine decarboxylase/phosphopantothenate--cysteine ligase